MIRRVSLMPAVASSHFCLNCSALADMEAKACCVVRPEAFIALLKVLVSRRKPSVAVENTLAIANAS